MQNESTPSPNMTQVGSDDIPLYLRVRGLIRAAIESLQYPVDSYLPDERQFAELYGVSRITIRKALEGLAEEGLIKRLRGRGKGTIVCGAQNQLQSKLTGTFDTLFSTSQVDKIEVLEFDLRSASPDVAEALKIPVGSELRYIERVLIVGAARIAHVRNFIPLPLGRELDRRALEKSMLQEVLAETKGIELRQVDDEIEAMLADYYASDRLELQPGRPILSLKRVFVGEDGVPLNLTRLMIAGDRYKMNLVLQGGGGSAMT